MSRNTHLPPRRTLTSCSDTLRRAVIRDGTRHTPLCSLTLPSRANLIRCASRVSLAHAWRSAGTSS